MKIKIHRGQNQIGGSIIEVATERVRVIFDAGAELDGEAAYCVPEIEGLFYGETRYNAVFLSHYHADHSGLANHILDDIPVYMGEKAFTIMCASSQYRNIQTNFTPRYIKNGTRIIIGDLEITPISCDHSAFDSYMFLIENDNKKVLYTGDFRANGRKEFADVLENLPSVDYLIIEGTILSRECEERNIEENKLEEIGVVAIKDSAAPCFIYCAATNIDRIITAKNIAKRTGRVFLEDIYTARMAVCSGVSEIIPKQGETHVFITHGSDKEYEALNQFYETKIGMKSIAKKEFIMTVRPSMKNYLSKLSKNITFDGGILFYALWKGYRENTNVRDFLGFMENKGVKIHTLHTSGHADLETIDALIHKTEPKTIIPVHTENADYFNKFDSIILKK